mmetsp:Transcript_175543/g.557613  ORF Transcript_175543/g.557613 Transcript_175543/m.557613 type:complete len:88 (+) Transcript_175543:619-882(+)
MNASGRGMVLFTHGRDEPMEHEAEYFRYHFVLIETMRMISCLPCRRCDVGAAWVGGDHSCCIVKACGRAFFYAVVDIAWGGLVHCHE